MTKTILLFVACLTTALAAAQEITEKDLIGSWKMCAFDINGIHWDFKSDTVKLPPELLSSLGESQKAAMIADVREGLADYKEGTMAFKKGYYMEQSMAGQEASGTYTIEKKDNFYLIKVTNHDAGNTVETLGVALVNGQLHISMPDDIGGTTILIYCK
ncbi:hypothetical protein HYN59_00960 [Flavobacterium album]|uniref:Lipocalin-like domain-containing protein n=1 Tax=Flavobacterium album TaxID=2175091 RepID=A0A2S1QTN0_9FLAO|nr:hypothetical protein [Flavobacterium album]AWH83768.1 hypothetical protein HYN59_00960 [Flavobacterium album]